MISYNSSKKLESKVSFLDRNSEPAEDRSHGLAVLVCVPDDADAGEVDDNALVSVGEGYFDDFPPGLEPSPFRSKCNNLAISARKRRTGATTRADPGIVCSGGTLWYQIYTAMMSYGKVLYF
ncbi:hypothetical protein CCACVL1_30342 [Corchorus capsularis]|uniref:Uncharacterized protein n=1 Tax=Corchorus capsularis TaxID=210143 RepID=A0A1R3FXS0_COCAP|nr:hypothetical protein CCACVL1_30342 [Corchorus capsularis]